MMFEDAFDLCADMNLLQRIAEQVAKHTQVACMRQFDNHREIGQVVFQCRVGGVPHPFPAIDHTTRRDAYPGWVPSMAVMAQMFAAKLPSATATALYKQLAL